MHIAVHAEYNHFVKEVRSFSQEEIICGTPDYFTGLARQLGDYLKNVEHTVDELEWRTGALDDCLGYPTPWCSRSLELGSDYFTFDDKLDATLRGIGRRQVREAEEQAAIGSTPCSSIPDGTTACSTRRTRARPTPGRTRTKSRVETTNSRRALARLRAAKPGLYACVYWPSLPLAGR